MIQIINTRIAETKDSKMIYEWRNDELTRKMSHTEDYIEWEGHSKWFASSLTKSNRLLLMCEVADYDESVAMVRFDVEAKNALVSINLSPQMRGMGLSKICLSEAINHFSIEYGDVISLSAEIRSPNIASIKIFEGIGFVKVRDNKQTLYYEYTL